MPTASRPRLFLLDGTALAYRAHFALARSGLTSMDGKPTGAAYGFTMTLRRILEQEKPDAIAVALDPKGPTFRHKQYAEYKATREKAPEEMVAQLDDIRNIVRAHGIPIFEVPGFEADDVIGTLTVQAEAAGYEVLLVTGDKDLMQLVGEHVRLYNIFKRDEDLVMEGVEEVHAKFGTTPDHVIDVLAIMGDASDNVPGVKGIGEKGAAKLIAQFGSVAGVLENLEEVKGKAREYIERDREQLLMSLELVTIDTNMALDPGIEAVGPAEPDKEALIEIFTALDFQGLRKRVAGTGAKASSDRDYVTIQDEEGLATMEAELRAAGTFAWDSETTGLDSLQVDIVGLSFSAKAGRAFYVPFNATPPVLEGGAAALLERLTPLLTDQDLKRIGQNHKYDALVLAGHGVDVPPPFFDTMVASYCVAGATRRHGLDDLALHYFNLAKIPTSELIGKGKSQITMAEVPVEQVAEYACEDADVTWQLFEVLDKELDEVEARSLFEDVEMKLVPVLTAMERRGITLDSALIEDMSSGLTADIGAAEEEVRELAGEPGLNLGSPKALGAVLFEKLRIQDEAGVKRPKRTKTGFATDHGTLTQHYARVPIVKRLLEYREVAKLKNTYVDTLPGFVNPSTGRVHCHLSQTTAATGRLASSSPNLQNIPVRTERGRKLREAFIPRAADDKGEWLILAADYSQVELRIMAHLSGDPGLKDAFEKGQDIHASTAQVVFNVGPEDVDRAMRSQAKAINFGLLYGMGPQRLARETGLTLLEAQAFIQRYFAAFPRVREWIDATLEGARENGYVETLLGRRRTIADINSENQRARAFAENAAVNTPVQGSAADVIKLAMIALEERLTASDLAGEMLLQVHDELLLEVPASELEASTDLVRDCMEHALDLDVPLKVEFGSGRNWLEAH
ncbi:MAG TPA: DNA polymerase I [Planctomycetes bacterium]|nr:DNA polymerase I [Planctomycetota bacterium]HIK60544.1 DNA polymerase I [Planctomycetota bacterium]